MEKHYESTFVPLHCSHCNKPMVGVPIVIRYQEGYDAFRKYLCSWKCVTKMAKGK